ncbi:hypothetical protein D3C87_1384080 [compost metagenome]
MEQDRELVASYTGNERLGQESAHTRRSHADQLVTDRVAERIIHCLEPIKIDKQKAMLLVSLGAAKPQVQLFAKMGAVCKPRQHVV